MKYKSRRYGCLHQTKKKLCTFSLQDTFWVRRRSIFSNRCSNRCCFLSLSISPLWKWALSRILQVEWQSMFHGEVFWDYTIKDCWKLERRKTEELFLHRKWGKLLHKNYQDLLVTVNHNILRDDFNNILENIDYLRLVSFIFLVIT